MSQSQNELDTIRQRARQAVEYYKRQNNENSSSGNHGSRGNLAASPLASTYHRPLDGKVSDDPFQRVGGQLQGQRSSMEDMLQGGVAPASSNSFYRAKMKKGIIDLRSSYNERIGSGANRQRSRTFHGPHGPRTRTQTYAADALNHETSSSRVGERKQREPPPPPPQSLASPPSPSPPQHFPHPTSVGARVGVVTGNRRSSRGLYRSNSNLEMDSVEYVDDADLPPSTSSVLHRQYGSTSSLDILASNSNQESYADVLKDFKNGGSREPRLLQLLQQQQQVNLTLTNGTGSAEKDEEDSSDHGKSSKSKKSKDRKARAKSLAGGGESNSSAGILKKLRGAGSSKHEAADTSAASKSDDKMSEEAAAEEKLRQKAFAHFDCQSVGVRLSRSTHALHTAVATAYMKNVTTGASAASVKRNSYAVSSEKDLDNLVTEEDDAGDGKCNELVESCPFFRNEIGGEGKDTVTAAKLTAYKSLPASSIDSNSSSSSFASHFSAISHSPMVRHPACCGVAILDSSPSPLKQILPPLVTYKHHVIEYIDHGAYYYRHFFSNYDHQNFFGTDDHLGPIAVSVRREKLDPEERTNNLGKADFGTYQYRIICRTSELTTLRGSIIEDAVPSSGRLSSSRGVPIKDVLEMALGPEVQLSCLKQAIPGPKTVEQLLKVDEQGICTTYKVGIMYCRAGQCSEEEMYNNENGSPVFDEFLNLIGHNIRLKGFDKYRGGLDCKTDTTGLYSYYTTFSNSEVMFHVSTLLPFTANNQQQLLRKRHIGNDIVTIVFQEPGALPFSPRTVRSQFQHVFVIVRVTNPNSEHTRYSIAVTRSKDVPSFGPLVPESGSFSKSPEFVDFLMAKVINAENAAHKSDKFRTMAQRTRQEYLKDLCANFSTTGTLDSGSKLSKFALGSGRKKEKTKHKVVPDMYTKGALVWNVQVEDLGSALQVECFLALAADTIVLVDSASKDVIFTVPCSTVIGWTLQASSIRLYFGQGEYILLRPFSGDMEEMTEIITRLTAVSQGTETVKMVLKRNGMGQLGFHIQSEGIVTDVEPYGFAWEVGLRKGSRLVEICKVATITLTHEQIVDLLRTSAVVKVVVVPPLEDGTPRGLRALSTHLPFTSLVSLRTALFDQSQSLSHQPQANQLASRSLPQLPLTSNRGDGKPTMSGSRSSVSTPSSTPSHLSQGKINSSSAHYDHPQKQRPGTSTSTTSPMVPNIVNSSSNPPAHGYSDSTLSSGRGSDDGKGSYYNHSHQESDIYGSSHDGRASSSGDEPPHSRNGSQDSTDYSLSGSTTSNRRVLSSSVRQTQSSLQRRDGGGNFHNIDAASTNAFLASTESIYSAVSQHSNYPLNQRRQFAMMEYASGNHPITGNIALELLKQTQNTKYLLGQEAPANAHPAPPSSHQAPPVSNTTSALAQATYGSSSVGMAVPIKQDVQRGTSREDTYPRRKDSSQLRKTYSAKKHFDSSPMSSTNSSPRSSSKNLSGMSSEESLSSRLRPGRGMNSGVGRLNFQEELKRLIDPDISESDLATLSSQSRVSNSRRSGRHGIQRTYSDESLHSSKGGSGPSGDLTIGTNVIFTTTAAAPKVADTSGSGSDHTERLSPRAVSDVNRPRTRTLADGRRITDATSLDWSDLVTAASRAIESDSRPPPPPPPPLSMHRDKQAENSDEEVPPPPRPPSPKDEALSAVGGIPAWLTLSSNPEQRCKELENFVLKLQQDLEKERNRSAKLDAQVQDLRADNVRLQEESQTAAAQLRRFTEWFFNTIDRQ